MNKENVNKNVCLIKDCDRPTHKKSNCCIFHASAKEKTEREFRETLKEYVNIIKDEDKDYDFKGFVFIGIINFREDLSITIFKNANFGRATFKGSVNFGKITFKGHANFREATFKRYADFGKATFKEHANFKEAIFEGSAGFEEATFEVYADFRKATFERYADFRKATFKGHTEFMGANFKGKADFVKATFEGSANFGKATFEDDADFRLKYFARVTNFSRIKVFSGKKLFIRVNNKGGKISFERAYLENVYLNVELNEGVVIDFTDTLLRNTYIQREQIENHILQEKKEEYLNANKIFLLLKNNFHSIGKYKDESWAFKKEKDMERKDNCHFKSLHKWLWSCVLNGIFGYGEQPVKVIISAMLIIFIFTFLFMSSGISNVDIDRITTKNFFDCIYFSTVTFTTLGYGDFRPLEGSGRILAGTEAFIGAFMMALFVYTFARRTGGR